MELREDEVRAPVESHVRRVALHVGARSDVSLGDVAVAKRIDEEVQQLRLSLRGHTGRVLDGVGDSAKQVCDEYGVTEITRENANAERERARYRR